MGPTYFASVGPKSGAMLYCNAGFAFGVQDRPGVGSHAPIGIAFCTTWLRQERDEDAPPLAVFKLTVHKAEVPGRWLLVDRRFISVEEGKDAKGVLWGRRS